MHWDATEPTGILSSFAGSFKHLLDDYSFISSIECGTALSTRTNPRAIQNSKAMYKTLKNSIFAEIRTTIFDQIGNLPDHDDGPTLFILITKFILSSAIQLLMISFRQILNFDLTIHKFVVPMINTQLNHLFVLASTNNRTVSDPEKLQHIVTAYDKICQPELWAQWVRNSVERIENGTLTLPQNLTNDGTLKYTKIILFEGRFAASCDTVQKDIVAMMGTIGRKKKTIPVTTPPERTDRSTNRNTS